MSKLIMNEKEREQLIVFKQLEEGLITRSLAAKKLGVTSRWLRTKYKRYLAKGVDGLIHKNRGKASPNRWNNEQKTFAIELLRTDWHDFGPTFATEKLMELHQIEVSSETLRQVMIAEGLWSPEIKKQKHRARRRRKDIIGAMIQLDGSPHDWFEGRAPKCTLLVFIDDATSQILWLEFADSESFQGVALAAKHYFEKCGRPISLYVDYGSVFSVNVNNQDREKLTQFQRAMKELNIKIIYARSPQAKGRVERVNQTLQDRLVKEMRLAGISSMEAANQYLQEGDYLSKHNAKFAVGAAVEGDLHRSLENYDLKNILCIKEDRVITNDFTVSYNCNILQLSKEQPTIIRPKERVMIYEHLDGAMSIHIRKCQLNFKEIGVKKHGKLKPVEYVNLYPNDMSEQVHSITPAISGKTSDRPNTAYKRSENSRRWASGLARLQPGTPSQESSLKLASPAIEAECKRGTNYFGKKRN